MTNETTIAYVITWSFKTDDTYLDALTREAFARRLILLKSMPCFQDVKLEIADGAANPSITITGNVNRTPLVHEICIAFLRLDGVEVITKSVSVVPEQKPADDEQPPFIKTHFYTRNTQAIPPQGPFKLEPTSVPGVWQICLAKHLIPDLGIPNVAVGDMIDNLQRVGHFSASYAPHFDAGVFGSENAFSLVVPYKAGGLGLFNSGMPPGQPLPWGVASPFLPHSYASPAMISPTINGWHGYFRSPLSGVLEFIRRDMGLPYSVCDVIYTSTCRITFPTQNAESISWIHRLIEVYLISEGLPGGKYGPSLK